MDELISLATPQGRKLLRSLYHELRYERQYNNFDTLRILWAISTGKRSPQSIGENTIHIRHRLSIWAGTRLWLEEIVNRYYYSTILSFVYGGAAILLVVVGLRRFSTLISDTVVLLSIGLEALLLLILFTVLYFSPSLETEDPHSDKINDLVIELGEIGRDMASIMLEIHNVLKTIETLTNETARLADAAECTASHTAAAITPNPDLIPILRSVNESLLEFKQCIEQLSTAATALRRDMIEQTVQSELRRFFTEQLSHTDTSISKGQ